MKRVLLGLTAIAVLVTSARAQHPVDATIERELPALVEVYKKLHAAPELSCREEKTSAFLAAKLRELGFTVAERVGKYADPSRVGYGVVAVLKNGDGPTVLVRSDMDALPVEEKTGLPYASKVRVRNEAGDEVPVMHACGHDIHVTCLLGTAQTLVATKDQWRGTLVLVGQPAEELGLGARAMLADGLYTRFPKPDFILALHDSADLAAGTIGYVPGYAMANVDSVDITIRGIGGHGSAPESTKDPIVIAAETIVALQTIVSREVPPLSPAVVTVGSIHGGTTYNIIPDEVKLQLTVRSYEPEVRAQLLAAIERITKGIALAAGVPPDRAPTIAVRPQATESTYNSPELTERLAGLWRSAFGAERVRQLKPAMVGEDVGALSLEGHEIPLCLFRVGAIDPKTIERHRASGVPLPSLHSSGFAPVPEPTIRAGVTAMTLAVLDLMKK
jgi:hippurate hydrolase